MGKALRDLVDRRNNRDRHEPNQGSHQKKHGRFDGAGEVLDELVQLVFVKIGKVVKVGVEVPRALPDFDDAGCHRREESLLGREIFVNRAASLYLVSRFLERLAVFLSFVEQVERVRDIAKKGLPFISAGTD
ncbi:MAG: hypothetical protein UX66_C0002G0018, partial [Parcubacteria group bacterium GW2011_GWF2_46_8]